MKQSNSDLLPDTSISGTADRASEVRELKQQSDVKKALEQTSGTQPGSSATVKKKQKMFVVTYLVTLLLLSGTYYFLRLQLLSSSPLLAFLQRADFRIKTRLVKKMLAKLNAEPDRTLFPKANAR
ncbi:MAG TPA: hypothetical protein VGN86_18700 [Pyrinomonadaceae bacterium]|jgi:hypothetical protein|nr:hypothetical protein [Pyrinomonadaceae bacterium]